MGWQDNKWNQVPKIPNWVAQNPRNNLYMWSIRKSDAKLDYDEGDIITTDENPVWRTDPTGPTQNILHNPCGYWGGSGIIYYTTLMYPVLVLDSIDNSVAAISGLFKFVFIKYSIDHEDINNTINFSSGIFKDVMIKYSIDHEDINNVIGITSAVFKDVIIKYTNYPLESINNTINFSSAVFRDAIIKYTNYPEESVQTTGIDLSSGEFYV